MRFFLFIVVLFATFINAFAQIINVKTLDNNRFIIPLLDVVNLKSAPKDSETIDKSLGMPLLLTLPDGKAVKYNFLRNDIISQEMVNSYPDLYTYSGYSDKFRHHYVSLTLYKDKIHISILGDGEKAIYVDQISDNQYEASIGEIIEPFECGTDHSQFRPFMPSGARTSTNGATLKNYSLGVVITDEYEAGNGSGAAAIAAAVATINDMTSIYKRDLAVTFTATVRPETSTFDVVPPSNVSPDYGGTVVAAYFTQTEYDLGHVFHKITGNSGGGAAYVGVVCNDTGTPRFKGRAWSQSGSNVGYSFMSVVAHEVAHMFGAKHTFNGQANFCNQGLSPLDSFEPGSGTTLMAYPGVCTTDNITEQSGSIISSTAPYFHVRSLEQMVAFITSPAGNSCATPTSTNNSPPTAIANPCNATNITIPANTPFELTGSHTDGNSDAVTYNWEQYNPGPPHGAPNVACGATSGPIFRSYQPTTSPTRYFPSLTYILNNTNAPLSTVGECLPTVNRTLNFRLTVRDNNPNGGGIDVSALQLTVSTATGPLSVTEPNTNVTWTAGSSYNVTWSGSNTTSLCNTVNIKLSVDGGQTFSYTLATNTPNDGSQSVTLPTNLPASTTGRIKVESSCFSCIKFFDISNVNFTLSSSCLTVGSSICPPNPITLPVGDPLLNLGLTPSYGNEITSKTLTTSGSSVSSSFNLNPVVGPGTCTSGNFGYAQASLKFKISTPGLYTFSTSIIAGTILSVYNGTYTPGSACTNYLGSTAYDSDGAPGGFVTIQSSMTLDLTNTCGEYTAVLFRSTGNSSTVTITGPAGAVVYENNTPTGSGYSYTYTAVNTTTNTIQASNATSNFTTLGAGSYCIYGVRYLSTLNPNTWIGQSFSQLFTSGNCLLESYNCKSVTITGGCSTNVTSSANSGPGTLRDIASCAPDGAIITFSTSANPTLTSPLLINKNLTIDGNVNGLNQPNTTITLNFSGSYGIKINPSKIITFKDIKVNHTGTASPVIQNEGQMTLNNSEVKGNVNPVINNAVGSNVTIANTVVVKK